MPREAQNSNYSNADQTPDPSFYEHLLIVRGYLRRNTARMHQLINPLPGMRILDFGCGTGEDVDELTQKGGQGVLVVGVDKSKDLFLPEAQRRFPTGVFTSGDGYNLPFVDDSFDVVTSDRPIAHIPEPQKAIEEMVRVTRPGGRILTFEPDWEANSIRSDMPIIAQQFLRYLTDSQASSRLGREMDTIMQSFGLEKTAGWLDYMIIRNYHDLAVKLLNLRKSLPIAVEKGYMSNEEAYKFRKEQVSRGRADNFRFSMQFFGSMYQK